MGTESKHFYRFVFLRSDEWSSVRLEALLREKAKCQICSAEDIANDAHHIIYPKSVWETQESDLVILCRGCHKFIHSIFEIQRNKERALIDFLKLINVIRMWRVSVFGDLPPIKRTLTVKHWSRKIKNSVFKNFCVRCKNGYAKKSEMEEVENPSGHKWLLCKSCANEFHAMNSASWQDLRKWLRRK